VILKQLVDYYRGNAESLPPFGFEYKEISFLFVLSREGDFLDIQDMRDQEGGGRRMLVPGSVKRSGVGVFPNHLWDNAKYVFGIGAYNNQKQRDALEQKRRGFLENLKNLSRDLGKHSEIRAVIRFLEGDFLKTVERHPLWQEILKSNGYISFSVESTGRLVCQERSFTERLSALSGGKSEEKPLFCLLTGQEEKVARLHPTIQGVYGAQGSGANLISYNLESVESFGKLQGYNAPVGETAAFAYSTALNHLLDSSAKVAFNEAMTVVFWSQKKTVFEDLFREFLKSSSTESLWMESEEDYLPFYVHALSPNGARLSLRFSWEGSIGDLKKRIAKHFEDLKIVHYAKERDLHSVYSLLHAFSSYRDIKHVRQRLAGEFLLSILNDLPYPQPLLSIILGRLADEEGVSRRRVALLKAWINRASPAVKISSSLDLANQSIGYLLGRLFAVLEQESRQFRKKNTAVRNNLYKMASIMPGKIFPHLVLSNARYAHSLQSIDVEYFQKIKDLIIESFTEFPSSLSLQAQGEFAIGYYHQKQQMFLEIQKR